MSVVAPWAAALAIAGAIWLWPWRGGLRPTESADPLIRHATVRELADTLDLLALALESGAPVAACLEQVAGHADPPLEAHLRQVAAAMQWGVDPRAAWDDVPAEWAPAGAALALAETSGTPPAGHLREAAARVRRAEHHRVEIAGAKVAVRLVLPLGACFLPAFVLLTVVPVVVALARELLQI